MRHVLVLLSYLLLVVGSVVPAHAQRTPANTKIVPSTNGAFLTETVSNPAIRYVVYEMVIGSRYQDPGHLTQSATVKLKGPLGTQATIEMEKVSPTLGSGKPYPVLLADGSRAITLRDGNAYEEYARYLSKIYPGITVEQLRQMYSPEELDILVENFMILNRQTMLNEGITATAILQKDTCATALRTYRVRIIVDLGGINAADRVSPVKVAASITTNPPATEQAALIKTGDASDGKLKGKRLALLETSDTKLSTLRFVHYSGNRRARVIKAKKPVPVTHPRHGLMLKSALPVIKKVKKITVEQIGPEGRNVYSVCAPITSKKPVRLNGFKGK